MSDDRTEPPWAELDDGVRETVRALWDAGFDPTDSGDGSKYGIMEDALEVIHVHMQCDPGELVDESNRLFEMVRNWTGSGNYEGNRVEASYSPDDGVGIISLYGCVVPAWWMIEP